MEISSSPKPVWVEQYLEERIIEYLSCQNDIAEGIEGFLYDYDQLNELERNQVEKQKTLVAIEELLNDILDNVDKTILFEKDYNKFQKEHHQFPLFCLEDIITDFAAGPLLNQLCFRELLLISNLDEPNPESREGKFKTVGGMCLKIELVKGCPTQPPTIIDQNNRDLLKKLKAIKEELSRPITEPTNKPQQGNQDIESEEEQLRKYEDYLHEQMKQPSPKFVVHLSSELDVDGSPAGSTINAWVDKDFHTLEERRREYIERYDQLNEETVYLALQENKYYIRHQESGESTNEIRKYVPLSGSQNLMGEGANFILMRYLALTKYEGTFELSAIYINGTLCRNIYECKGPQRGIVNGNNVELVKIYRTIVEKCGIIHLSSTVLTVHGLLISHEWDGCPYFIHINPLSMTTGKPVPYDYLALKRLWKTDIQLVSKYLDQKVESQMKIKTYLKDHSEIEDFLADYLNSMLLLKPTNILNFTLDYFSNYEPFKLPATAYFNDFKEDKFENTSDLSWL